MLRRILLTISLVVILLTNTTAGLAQGSAPEKAKNPELAKHVPGEILIRFSPGVNSAQAVDHMSAMGVTHKREISAIGVHLVKLPPGLSVEKAMDLFSRRTGVEFAEPNYILQVQAPASVVVDELEQWALEKIEAPLAWDEFGSDPNEPLLAIVDTGITPDHPDLAANVWENPGETGLDDQGADKSTNGIDDDINGYVDDWQGWDFVNNDNESLDDNMHGTAVSSVAAGEENGIGVVGVCPWCPLLGVKVLDSNGSGTLDAGAEGIIYAADMGARVINLSLGAGTGTETLAGAVTYAWNVGAVVIAAAGNNGARMLFYPAAYPEAMAIASTDVQDYHTCFSNHSPDFISVAAPGAGVIVADITNQETGYGYYNGTSLSAPHVTGLAGLLFSQDPGRTNDEVRAIIENSAVDLGPQGFDDAFGHGRIDAYRAVTGDFSPVTPPDGLFSSNDTATGYGHARKLVRVTGDPDTLHMIWHTKQEGPTYRIRYANSTDEGANWNLMPDVYSSSNETYHPALATDGEYLYAAIPSKTGPEPEAVYQILFTRKLLPDGDWEAAVPIMGGNVHTVRPDMYFDPSSDRLHVIASSLDDAPDLYYRGYDTQSETWADLTPFNPSNSTQNTRYATLHANGSNIYVVARTIALFCIGETCYPLASYIHSARSTDGGASWDDSDKEQISSFQSITPTDYGISLAGVGDRLYMGYEVGRNMYFRRYDATWSDYLELETSYAEPDPSNPLNSITYSYKWPTITQAEDGQAWLMYEEHKESALYGVLQKQQYMRHYVGGTWSDTESMGSGTYANFKLGTSADRLEWVSTQCNGAPFFIEYDWLSPEPPEPPQPQSHHIPLVPGWNLVSFNLIPANTSIDVVLGSIAGSYDLVFAWDGSTQTWQMYDPAGPAYSNTLQNLDQKRGFWIYATFPVILTVAGTPPTTTDIPVYFASSGWNLVGYPSVVVRDLPGALQDHGVGTDFSLVYSYQSNDPVDTWKLFDRVTPPFSNDLTSMTPGLGYWIKVSADNTWQVNYLGP